MIRNIKYLFLIIPLLFLFSCNESESEYNPPDMVTEIVPSVDDSETSGSIYGGSAFDDDSDKPLIHMQNDEVLISTITLNLDLDTQDEQVLVFKERSNPDGKIHIAVADYNNVQNNYTRAWESITTAENNRSFMVQLDDLIGDHNNEIVCSGRDSQGRTTLDVFWKNTTERNVLGYMPIFNFAERGTIEIDRQERSRGYLQGLKNGISYTITVTSEAGDNELVTSKYYWDFPLKKYQLLSQEHIENKSVIENQLQEIVAGYEEDFYKFINGPWSNGDLIIYFDPKNESATFYTDDIQENYSWVNSYKVLSNLLYIRCRNEIINYIENEIYVRVIGLNEVSITVRDIDSLKRTKDSNDIWTNVYTRMGDIQQAETVKNLDAIISETKLPELSGQYISGAGDIIEFYGSDFYMKNSTEEIKGGFAVYQADITILSIKIIDENGIVTEERTFALEYSEEQRDRAIERTLVLTPGSLSIHGFHPSETEFYRLTQTETLEIASDEEGADAESD